MSGDDLASEYADTMVGSVADIMGRYDGTGHDGDCERAWGPLCEQDSGLDFTWCAYHDDEHDDPCDCQERASDELVESYALELVAERGEPYSVLLTYGGPTAWIEWTARMGTDSATLHVSWASSPVIRRSSAIREMAAYYAELMGDDE